MITEQTETIRRANMAIRGITHVLKQDQIMSDLFPDYCPYSEQDHEDLLIGVELLTELIKREAQ